MHFGEKTPSQGVEWPYFLCAQVLCGAYYILAERWENRFYGSLEGGQCYMEKQTLPRAGGGAQELWEVGSM